MLSMCLALAVAQLLSERPLLSRKFLVVIVALQGVCLLLTFSRGSMVAAAAALGLIAVLRHPKLLLLMLAAVLVVVILPWTQDYVVHFVEGIQLQDLATQMRIGEYTDALKLMARYPVFGVGFAGSPDIDLYLGVAMVYLTIGGEMGVLGLLAFIAVIGTLFATGWRVRNIAKARPHRDPVWLGLYAAITAGLVGGVFDHYLFNLDFHHSVTIFWLFLGLAAATSRLLAAKAEQ
jgi:O-antigen ligase